MTPSPELALRMLMGTLMTEVAPKVSEGYLQSSVSIIAVAQMFLAEELDRAAEVRVWENRELRALLRQGAEIVPDEVLRSKLEAAAATSDADLRVSSLSATNAELCRLLIDLQVALEERSGEAARVMAGEVWQFLAAAAKRRSFSL